MRKLDVHQQLDVLDALKENLPPNTSMMAIYKVLGKFQTLMDIQLRVRAFSATVPFRGRAVRWSNHMWNIVRNWWVAFLLMLEQNGT